MSHSANLSPPRPDAKIITIESMLAGPTTADVEKARKWARDGAIAAAQTDPLPLDRDPFPPRFHARVQGETVGWYDTADEAQAAIDEALSAWESVT